MAPGLQFYKVKQNPMRNVCVIGLSFLTVFSSRGFCQSGDPHRGPFALLKELTTHEILRLSRTDKIYLGPKTIKNLNKQLEPEAEKYSDHITGAALLDLLKKGLPLSLDLLGALRVTNESSPEEIRNTVSKKLIHLELDRFGNSGAILQLKEGQLKVSKMRELVNSDRAKNWDEKQWRETLASVRLNARALLSGEFVNSYGKELPKRGDFEAPKVANEKENSDTLADIENKAPATRPNVDKNVFEVPKRFAEAPINPLPAAGAGLSVSPKIVSLSPSFFKQSFGPTILFKIAPEGISEDNKLGVVGATPPGTRIRNELIGAIASGGKKELSIEMLSHFAGADGVSSCQATNLKKEFNGFSCKAVFATAKHCVVEAGVEASRIDLGPLGSFGVTYAGGIDLARLSFPEGGTGLETSDIAAIHVEKKGHCPDDSKLPSFRIAHRPPKNGVVIDGHDLLIAGVKPSQNSLMEVNLADSFNPIGIYPGNSGGGVFSPDLDGKLVFSGVLSAKFVDARFADRLGLIEAQAGVLAWFSQEVIGPVVEEPYPQPEDRHSSHRVGHPHKH